MNDEEDRWSQPEDRAKTVRRIQRLADRLQWWIALGGVCFMFWISLRMGVWQRPSPDSVAFLLTPHWLLTLPASLMIGLITTFLDYPRVVYQILGWTRYAEFRDEIAGKLAAVNYGTARGYAVMRMLIFLAGMVILTGQCEYVNEHGIFIQVAGFAAPRHHPYSDVRGVYTVADGNRRAGAVLWKSGQHWMPGNFAPALPSNVLPAGDELAVLTYVSQQTGLPLEVIPSMEEMPRNEKEAHLRRAKQ